MLLAFYFLRLWFAPVAIIGRTVTIHAVLGRRHLPRVAEREYLRRCDLSVLLRVFQNAGTWNVFGLKTIPDSRSPAL